MSILILLGFNAELRTQPRATGRILHAVALPRALLAIFASDPCPNIFGGVVVFVVYLGVEMHDKPLTAEVITLPKKSSVVEPCVLVVLLSRLDRLLA